MSESIGSIDHKTNPNKKKDSVLKPANVVLKPSRSCQSSIQKDLDQKPEADKLTELAHFKELLGEPEEDAL